MALLYGQVGKFHPELDQVSTYIKIIQLYFESYSVEKVKKVAILIQMLWASVESLSSIKT